MLKKRIMIIILSILLVINILRFLPYGTTKYHMPNSSIDLEIPKYSIFVEECCMFSANFKSYRSTNSLKKELEAIMDNYEKKECNNKTYYYNKDSNITISEYGVKKKFILNEFYIVYDKGDYSQECE